ncbi:GrpB family protein [Nesterenkonia salmonea]|uniref:GrpB family protein n=1 Tax=Nesterenkonia salmonea TaxID=1804987 RepID=A0A5R9B709_9MICC|nr:GrpB family protein [Nesterenkonia salmonea]TLP92360.1 GrpB family protein [Nesterenkonia salmonea]
MEAEQPVFIVPSRHSEWNQMATEMMSTIRERVTGAHLEHIGSTAVPDLPAKDVVDLLVGVDAARVPAVARQLGSDGFDLEGERDHHCWLSFPSRSAREYVIHVVEYENRQWNKRIAFRDLLRSDANARDQYLNAKISAAKSTSNWDDYTQSKTSIVSTLLDNNSGR